MLSGTARAGIASSFRYAHAQLQQSSCLQLLCWLSAVTGSLHLQPPPQPKSDLCLLACRYISQWHPEVEAQQQQQQQQLEQQPHAAVSPLLQQPGSIQQHWPQQQLLLQQQHSRHGLHSTHQQHQQQPYAWSSSRALHTQDSSGPSSQELYEDYTASMQESQDEASSSSQLSTRIGNLNASQELDELLKVWQQLVNM